MTKSVYLLEEYRKERRRQQCQNLNAKLLEVMDAIAEDYQAHVQINLNLERVIHEIVKADEKGRK